MRAGRRIRIAQARHRRDDGRDRDSRGDDDSDTHERRGVVGAQDYDGETGGERDYRPAAVRQREGRRQHRDGRGKDGATALRRRACGEPHAEDHPDRREGCERVRVAEGLREERPFEWVDGARPDEVARERVDDHRDDRRVRQNEQVLRCAAPDEHHQRERHGRVHGGAPQLEDGLYAPVGPQPRHADPGEERACRREPQPRGPCELELARCHDDDRGGPRCECARPDPGGRVEAALVERERDDECRRHEQQGVRTSDEAHSHTIVRVLEDEWG